MAYAGKININGKTYPIGSTLYGTCSTSASTAEKMTDNVTGFDRLMIGATIHLKMAFENTAESPTLNVNGTGALPIYSHGSAEPDVSTSWSSGQVISLTYDGTGWQMNDQNDLFEELTSLEIEECFQ